MEPYTGEPRTAKVLNPTSGRWKKIDPMQIKAGNIFQMLEPDGSNVKLNDVYIFVAACDAYAHPELGRPTIQVY